MSWEVPFSRAARLPPASFSLICSPSSSSDSVDVDSLAAGFQSISILALMVIDRIEGHNNAALELGVGRKAPVKVGCCSEGTGKYRHIAGLERGGMG